jgi:hypothetical protein
LANEAELGAFNATTVATHVADPAALTSIDLDPALGTPDAEGDLGALTGADAGQDNNNATIAAQFNALRADVAAIRTQLIALLAARATAGEEEAS